MRRRVLLTLGLSLLLTMVVYRATGLSLGLYFGGLALCAILVPYQLLFVRSLTQRLLLAFCLAVVPSIFWLVLTLLDPLGSLAGWAGVTAILLSCTLVQVGLLRCVQCLTFPPFTAAGLTMLLWLLYLACPIWLFHHIPAAWMQHLISIHPLFVTNAAEPLSIWTESPLVYQILNLNQDVYYALPSTPISGILTHAIAGALLLALGQVRDTRAS